MIILNDLLLEEAGSRYVEDGVLLVEEHQDQHSEVGSVIMIWRGGVLRARAAAVLTNDSMIVFVGKEFSEN